LTGDICKKDKDGFFYYVDRKKDLIIKGGVNILPSEIDEQILGYSKNVLEVATIGEKNQFYGEIVKSFIILKKNNKNFIFNLKTFLLKRLGYLKCPDIIKVIKKFPKTPSGKIIKRLLKNC
jgi:acyl-CoA synthetase (AMP-forming)/AMP-acid ligase II